MMKATHKKLLTVAILSALGLTACGGGGSTSSATTRSVTGTINDPNGTVVAVVATNTLTNATTSSSVRGVAAVRGVSMQRAAIVNGQYTLDLEPGASYTFSLVDGANNVIGTFKWNSSASGGATTSVLNLTDGAAIDLGSTSIPAGGSGQLVLVSSTNNPLEVVDSDNDGTSDYADADDDNDGTDDATDTDDNNDGLSDVDQEADSDSDGVADLSDSDSVDGDIDSDGADNSSDTDDDNDGIADTDDDDVDGDGIPNSSDDDIDGDHIANADDSDANGDGVDNESDDDIDGDGILNNADNDMDGDGVLNDADDDIDGDGVVNGADSTPSGV